MKNEDNGAMLYVEEFDEPLCEEVKIIEKRISLPLGDETLVVKVCSKANGIPFEISREELVQKKIFNTLTRHGLSIVESDEAYAELRSSINESERKAPVVYTHEKIGFSEMMGKKCFLAYHPIGCEGESYASSVNRKFQAMLKPKGSFEEWVSFIRKHIVPHTERSLALMLGATAPLAYILKEEGILAEVPVYVLLNATSTGKSSLLFLISSISAFPQKFIGNFNATSGALYALLEQNGGLVYLCDEATHVPHIDWDDLLYVLPTGKEKRRLNSKGELKPPVEFGGAVVMTSEISVLGRSLGTGGEKCRILEFSLNCFENEPTLPDKIREFCSKNYGWATEPLIKLLLDEHEKQRVIEKFRKFSRRLHKSAKFDVSGPERRLIARCALILTAGWLLTKAIKCNFDLRSIEDYLSRYLEETVAHRDDRDEADKILDKISGFVCSNLEKFPTVESLHTTSKNKRFSSFWGATGYYGLKRCIWVEEGVLKDRILPKEMQNANITLQSLHKKEYVIKFHDKNYRIKRDFGGIEAKYLCFLLPSDSSLIKKIEDSSARGCSVSALNASIGALHDKEDFAFLDASKNIAYVSLAHATMQSYSLTISTTLKKQMSLASKSTLYATPLPAQRTVLLSKTKVSQNSLPCHFDQYNESYAAKGISVTTLQAMLELNIPIGYQIVTQEVNLDQFKGQSIAAITFNEGTASIEPADTMLTDYTDGSPRQECSYRKVLSLLEEDE